MVERKNRSDTDRMNPPPESSGKARNITETEAWKSSSRGAKRFWVNYKNILKDSFNRMTRQEQEDLIIKFAMIVTLGVTCLVILIFYPVTPRLMRVLGLPVALLVAWWAGRRIVGPVVIDRMEGMLRKDRDNDNY
ncbi:MAG: hypothetical protein K2X77_08795 [Candidatus Obscuribacterales bacterium]|jgi:hypothetical protein|nr:hypothetical protein [Candidatus Obscuribacterales bacterium]